MNTKIDLNQKLSQHFTLWEFVISQTAERFGIDNTPNDQIIRSLKKLCETVLEPARFALGPIKISSGYRCSELNQRIGGSKTSAHMLGFAADLIPLKVTKLELAKWLSKNVEYDEIILEYGTLQEPAWIHISSDPRNRRELMRIVNGSKLENIKL